MKSMKRWMAYLAVMAIAIASGCSDDKTSDPVVPETKNPTVALTEVAVESNSLTVKVEPKDAELCRVGHVVKGEAEPTAEQLLANGTEVSATAATEHKIENLQPETSYVVLAAVRNGEKSDLQRIELKTKAATVEPQPDEDFGVQVRLSEEDQDWVVITVNPNDPDRYYFNYIIEDKVYEETYNGDPVEAVESEMEKIIAEYVDGWGGTREEALKGMLVKGEGTQSFPVLGNKSYYCYVVYADMETGAITSEPQFTPFESTKVEPSNNAFEIEVLETSLMGFKYAVTPSIEEDFYTYCHISTEEYESYNFSTLAEYADYRVNYYGIYSSKTSGYHVEEVGYLNPDTEYMIIVFGYNHGVRTTEPISTKVSTLPKGDPSKVTFDFTIQPLNAFQVGFSVTPSDNTVSYYYDLAYGNDTAEQVEERLYALLDENIAQGWPSSYAEYFDIFATYGGYSGKQNVEPNTEGYKVYAVGVDTETGEFAGEVFFSEVCQMPEHTPGDLVINVSIEKYFDGAELAELDPYMYSGWGEEFVFFFPTVSFENGYTENYYINLYQYVEGYENNDDEWAILALLSNGYTYVTEFYMPWDATGYLLGVGIDGTGAFTRVYREIVTLDRAGAAPAEEHPYISGGGGMAAKKQSKGLNTPYAPQDKQKISTIR